MTQLETAIRKMLEKNAVTFAELSRIEGFKGGMEIHFGNYNIVAWSGVSEEAVEILHRLRAEGVFHYDYNGSTTHLDYLIDGMSLDLPLAKDRVRYKEPHWLPVTLCLGVD